VNENNNFCLLSNYFICGYSINDEVYIFAVVSNGTGRVRKSDICLPPSLISGGWGGFEGKKQMF
jgi:hypothetical protein